MRYFVFFAIVALVVAAFAPRHMDKLGLASASPPASTTARAVMPAPARSSGPREMVIRRDNRGHFVVDGTVDGRRIRFMVDTGASRIALTKETASRLGIHPAQRDFIGRSSTANGVIRFAPVRLGMVEIGGIIVRNVDAFVPADEGLTENLLGMSFLSRLRRFEYREGNLVLEE